MDRNHHQLLTVRKLIVVEKMRNVPAKRIQSASHYSNGRLSRTAGKMKIKQCVHITEWAYYT